jgi:hypothetical protein
LIHLARAPVDGDRSQLCSFFRCAEFPRINRPASENSQFEKIVEPVLNFV